MANPEHLKHLKSGVDSWNRWRRKHHLQQPDLSHADLRGANLRSANLNNVNLRFANLEGANLGRAYLESAELEGAKPRGAHLFDADLGLAGLQDADLENAQLWHVRFEQADLRGAHLAGADLRRSDLSQADLRAADLTSANLSETRICGADLRSVCLRGADLRGAFVRQSRCRGLDLTGATMSATSWFEIDLSQARGLATVLHEQATSIGVDTLELTAAGLSRDPSRRAEVEAFFRHAGVREGYLDVFRAAVEQPAPLRAVFLHHSQADAEFAARLYEALQLRGVRCWRIEHPMLPGDGGGSEGAVLKARDRLLLCGSEASLNSWWVDREIDRALETESHAGSEPLLLTMGLDDYLSSDQWESPRRDAVRARLVADFSGWDDDERAFERALDRVVEALEAAPADA